MELIPTKQEIDDFIKEYAPITNENNVRVDLFDKNHFMPSMDELKGVFANV